MLMMSWDLCCYMLLLVHRRQSCRDRAGRALVVPACLRMDTRPTVSYSSMPSEEDLANAETLVLPGSNQDLEPTTACAEVPDTTPSGAPGPQASIEGQPPAAEQSQPELVLTEQAWTQAFQNYAKAKGVDMSNVTRDMIKSSAEGAVHWSTMQQDMSARGPSAQAMGRAFKHRPDVRETYGILLAQRGFGYLPDGATDPNEAWWLRQSYCRGPGGELHSYVPQTRAEGLCLKFSFPSSYLP